MKMTRQPSIKHFFSSQTGGSSSSSLPPIHSVSAPTTIFGSCRPVSTSVDTYNVDIRIPPYVYTDGACVFNGKPYAKAGYGVFFGEGHPWNISKQVPSEVNQTNNTGELYGMWEALKLVSNRPESVVVMTDSTYVIKCLTTYGEKMQKKNWSEDIPNKDIVKTMYELYDSIKDRVTIDKVKAHTGLTDEHSIGNDWADRLANDSIRIYMANGKPSAEKIYLTIPFAEKDWAKDFGAKWDAAKKSWYTTKQNQYFDMLTEKYGKH